MADDLLQQLRQGGRLETSGEFRLDPEKAREKLRDFRLPDPHRWVLELVSAANLLQAKELHLRIDTDEVEADFDGVFEPGHLTDFFNAAFRAATSDADIAARQLAIGVTAAEALRPSVLNIHSGALLLHLAPGQPRLESVPAIAGTRVYFKESFRAAHVIDFLRNVSGDVAEKTYLKKHAMFSTTRVFLDGKCISHGLKLQGLAAHALIDSALAHGQISITGGPNTRVQLVQYGVLVQTDVTASVPGADLVLDCPLLHRDMSNASFVQDDTYRALLERVEEAKYEALFNFFNGLPNHTWIEHRYLIDLVLRTIERIVELRHKNKFVPIWQAKLGVLLEEAVIWPIADRPAENTWKIEQTPRTSLKRVRSAGKIYFSTKPFENERIENKSPVLLFTKRHILDLTMAELSAYLDHEFEDVTEELENRARASHNRLAWQQKPWPSEIPKAQFTRVLSAVVGKFSVSIGITHPRGDIGYAVWVKDQWLLRRTPLTRDLPFEVLIAGPVEANIAFDGPAHHVQNKVLAAKAIELFQVMFREIAEATIGEPDERIRFAARNYLTALINGTFHEEILTSLGMQPMLTEIFHENAQLGSALVLHNYESLQITLNEVLDSLGTLADFGVFERVDSNGSKSIRELVKAAENDELYVVKQEDSSRLFALGAAIPDGTFIWTTPELDKALHRLFGKAVKPGIARVLSTAWYDAYLNRPKIPFSFESEHRFTTIQTTNDDETDIMVAWREPGTGSRERFTVRYFYQERVVEEVEWPAFVGEFWVNARGPGIKPNQEHGKLDRSKAVSKIEIRIRDFGIKIILDWLEEQMELPHELRHAAVESALKFLLEKDRRKLAKLSFLDVVGGGRISPELVEKHFSGVIPFVSRGLPLQALVPPGSVGVLVVEQSWLRWLFPHATLIDCTAYDQKVELLERVSARFLSRPLRQVTAPLEAVVEAVDEQPDLSIRVWMLPDADPKVTPTHVPIEVIFLRRTLCELSIDVPFGRFSAVVTGSSILPDVHTYDRLAAGQAVIETRVRALAERALLGLAKRPQFTEYLRHYLAISLRDPAAWSQAHEFLLHEPLFRMADNSFRSYAQLEVAAQQNGVLPWVHPGENITGMALGEVVVVETGSRSNWANTVILLDRLPWQHARAFMRSSQAAAPPAAVSTVDLSTARPASLEMVLTAVYALIEAVEHDNDPLLRHWAANLSLVERPGESLLVVENGRVALNAVHSVGERAAAGQLDTAPFITSALVSLFLRTVPSIDAATAQRLHMTWVNRVMPV